MARAAPLPFRPTRPPAKGKGRGARSNQSGRYEAEKREEVDDGWESEESAQIKTSVTLETPRKIVTFNDSPFVGFDRSINPYRGCEHGCIYCFARPTHAFMGLSPGVDFETKLFAKPDAGKLLRRELSHKNYQPRQIQIGTNTDGYQPIERHHRLMRDILKVLDEFNHPIAILTKSNLICRDIDILAPMAQRGIARAMLSVTTLDRKLHQAMEPRASAPAKRLEAIKQLVDAGIPTGVMAGPMIPGLNDAEMESILAACKEAGASFAGYTMLRLPLEVAPLFQEWLQTFTPNRFERIMRHLREMNGGRIYDPEWSRAATPRSVQSKMTSARFHAATKKLGLATRWALMDCSQFAVPGQVKQPDLFDRLGGETNLRSATESGLTFQTRQ